MSSDSILETPPSSVDDGELASALDVAPPSRRSVTVTRALVGLLLVALGATGATWWAHRTTSTAGSSGFPGAGSLPSGFPSGLPAGGSSGTGGGSGTSGSSVAATTGTVKLVDGDTVYVSTADGKVVKVKVGAATTVSKPGTVSDLTAGSTVVITGTTGSDGTVAAATVTERSAK